MMMATTTVMMIDGRLYYHDPATVGHATHGLTCWTLRMGDEAPAGCGPHAIVRAQEVRCKEHLGICRGHIFHYRREEAAV